MKVGEGHWIRTGYLIRTTRVSRKWRKIGNPSPTVRNAQHSGSKSIKWNWQKKRARRQSKRKIIFTLFLVIYETRKVCDPIHPYTQFKISLATPETLKSLVYFCTQFSGKSIGTCTWNHDKWTECAVTHIVPPRVLYIVPVRYQWPCGTISVTMWYDNSDYVVRCIFSVSVEHDRCLISIRF